MANKQKLALCLGGGGSKGAFEAGAVQALLDMGYRFDIVTGCSIGAFNGAMFVQQQFERARQLWDKITISGVIADGVNFEPSFEKLIEQKDAILPFIKNTLQSGVDISPLKELMEEYIDPDKLLASDIDFGLVTVAFPQMKPVFKTKSQLDRNNLRSWLLASASCFPAFPMCEIDGNFYLDGAYYDNLPIDLAFEMGADHVFAIDLKQQPDHEHYYHHPCVTYIKPTYDLGSFLYFEQSSIQANITMGYLDACKKLGKYKGNLFAFENFDSEAVQTFANKFCRRLVDLERPSDPEDEPIVSRLMADYDLSKSIIHKDDPSPLATLTNALELCMQKVQADPLQVYDLSKAISIVQSGYDTGISLPRGNEDTRKKLKSFTEDIILAELIKETAFAII